MRIENIDYSDIDQVEAINESKSAAKRVVTCSIADKEILSVREAAAWTNVSAQTLSEWRKEGLRYIRKGGFVFYLKQDIIKFLQKYYVAY